MTSDAASADTKAVQHVALRRTWQVLIKLKADSLGHVGDKRWVVSAVEPS